MAGRHPGRADYSRVFAGVPKVPAVKPYFWAVKLLTTAMGEAVSDFAVKQYNQYLAVFAGFIVFAIAIAWQFRTRGYRTWPYWSAVAMVAVFGTMVADAMHIGLGIPYKVSATLFAVSLAVIFIVWYRVEGTLSIHSIVTPRREFFYWATVICTFALGTATGDLTAITFHLGYIDSAFLFAGAICVPLIAWRLGANPVLMFWVAYILTRPIGASFADFFGMPKASGGLGIGHGPVSLVTLALVAASFAYLSRSGIDQPEPDAGAEVPAGTRDFAGYARAAGYPAPQGAPWDQPDPRYGDPRYQRADSRYQQDDPRYQQDDPRYRQDDPRYRQEDPRYWQDDPRYRQQAWEAGADGYGRPPESSGWSR